MLGTRGAQCLCQVCGWDTGSPGTPGTGAGAWRRGQGSGPDGLMRWWRMSLLHHHKCHWERVPAKNGVWGHVCLLRGEGGTIPVSGAVGASRLLHSLFSTLGLGGDVLLGTCHPKICTPSPWVWGWGAPSGNRTLVPYFFPPHPQFHHPAGEHKPASVPRLALELV